MSPGVSKERGTIYANREGYGSDVFMSPLRERLSTAHLRDSWVLYLAHGMSGTGCPPPALGVGANRGILHSDLR